MVLERGTGGAHIRCHRDYHLGQVLRSGDDLIVVDFEGEPDRLITERRLKCSPLRDVAGMLGSLHDAAEVARARHAESHPELGERGAVALEGWALAWYRWIATVFLTEYCHVASGAAFLPAGWDEVTPLLDAFLLERALSMLGRVLDHRPDRARIALRGVLRLLDPAASAPR
jgi:predicted trehalose synthase